MAYNNDYYGVSATLSSLTFIIGIEPIRARRVYTILLLAVTITISLVLAAAIKIYGDYLQADGFGVAFNPQFQTLRPHTGEGELFHKAKQHVHVTLNRLKWRLPRGGCPAGGGKGQV
jgi:hypothetical protein